MRALVSGSKVHALGSGQRRARARAIFRTRLKTTEEEIDELVAARLRRQYILTRADPPLSGGGQ